MKFGRIAKDYDPALGERPFYRRGASGPGPLAREEFRVAQQPFCALEGSCSATWKSELNPRSEVSAG